MPESPETTASGWKIHADGPEYWRRTSRTAIECVEARYARGYVAVRTYSDGQTYTATAKTRTEARDKAKRAANQLGHHRP